MSKIIEFEQNLTEIWPKWNKLWNCENVENTLKVKVFRKSILVCKYLRNESSDLYEILCGGKYLSCELKFKMSWRSVRKCARMSCKHVHSRFKVRAARVLFLSKVILSVETELDKKPDVFAPKQFVIRLEGLSSLSP